MQPGPFFKTQLTLPAGEVERRDPTSLHALTLIALRVGALRSNSAPII